MPTGPDQPASDPQLHRFIDDPRGSDAVISSLSNEGLARLLDALYRNLDTAVPEIGPVFWYEACLEESLRRHGPEPQTGVNISGPALVEDSPNSAT
jgi:hypothetical protein